MSTIFVEAIPALLAEALNTSEFVAGILCSLFLLMICIMPIILAKRGKSNFISEMIIGIVAVTASMALGWLPLYVGLLINLLVAIALSSKLKNWMG